MTQRGSQRGTGTSLIASQSKYVQEDKNLLDQDSYLELE